VSNDDANEVKTRLTDFSVQNSRNRLWSCIGQRKISCRKIVFWLNFSTPRVENP